jgi:hypothetical protein
MSTLAWVVDSLTAYSGPLAKNMAAVTARLANHGHPGVKDLRTMVTKTQTVTSYTPPPPVTQDGGDGGSGGGE